MEQTSGLYNPGFVGSQFHWWLGQVADSKSWRENQPKSHFKDRKDIPGWGYRYKVRIMGIHDAGEAIIESDQLPWAQVMYPITAGGGQGGSFQTPGIKQGCFVFGFFLDGSDEQVPIIMGVLGNNAKTIIGETSKEGGEDSTFGAKSGNDDLSDPGDDNKSSEEPSSSPLIESTDAPNKDNNVDTLQEEENEKESPMECVKHGNSLTSMQTHMGNFQKKYQKLMSQLNNYGTAAASKTPIDNPSQINSKIDELIDETSKLSAGSLLPSLNNTQNFLSEKISKITETINDAVSITDRLDNLKADVEAQSKLACVFNKIKGDLARLIGAGVRRSLARKQNRTPQNNNQVRPTGNNSGLIPPLPQEGFYTPMNPCETEDIIADVFSNVMGEITTGYQSAISPIAAGSGTPTQGRLASALSQENVIANLENGNLFGGLAAALGAGIGINADQSGAITSALKAGNYAAAISSLVDFSGSNAAIGGLSTALQSVANGDTIGAFRGLAGPLGIDTGIAGAIGGALGAIKGGDIGSLTNALGGLGGAAPQILNDVLGGRLPLSGIDIGGFGALGGLDFDLALASTFMSTAAAFLECDPKPECPIEDTYDFGNGGSSKEQSKDQKVNTNNIVEKVKENTVPEGAFAISAKGKAEALNNRINAATNITNIPSGEDLVPGSFGISDEARAEALANRQEVITDRENVLNQRIQRGIESTNIPADLPEGAFTITPKKKFNVPKIKKQITENIVDDSGNETTIQWKQQFPDGVTSTTVSESKSVENGVIIERKNITTQTSGQLNEIRNGKTYIFGVEVSPEDYNKLFEVQDIRERTNLAKEIISRY